MKALVLESYGNLVYREMPDPIESPDTVLVEIEACAICGSDVHGMDGSTGRRIPPVIMGHEAAGTVVSVGSDVTEFHPGDRVAMDSTLFCGTCPACIRGDVNLCDTLRVIGVSCSEYRVDGAFAERICVPARILYPLPDHLSFERAAMAEPLAIALHAISRLPVRPDAGQTAVVVGTGMVGLLVVQALHAAGCGRIIAVDPVPEKREMAHSFGATHTLDPQKDDMPTHVRSMTGGTGADASFEVVGMGQALRPAVSCLRKGGTAVLIGNLSDAVELPLQTVVTRQLSLYGSCASSGEYADALRMIADGTIDVDRFISAVAPLADGAEWMGRLYNAEPGLMKVILKP